MVSSKVKTGYGHLDTTKILCLGGKNEGKTQDYLLVVV